MYGYVVCEVNPFTFDDELEFYWSGTVDYPTMEDARECAEITLEFLEKGFPERRLYIRELTHEDENEAAMEAMCNAPI